MNAAQPVLTAMRLAGVFRARDSGAGFGIPVYVDAKDETYTAHLTFDRRLRGWLPCRVQVERLTPVPTSAMQIRLAFGECALLAFFAPDGTLTVGPFEDVARAVRASLPTLRGHALREAAQFLGDAEALARANAET